MTTKKFSHKLLSILLCLAMVLSYIPATVATAVTAGSTMDYVPNSKISDPSTMNNWENYFGPSMMTTEFSGAVWTDKSVFTSATNELPGVTMTNSNNFLVALSAIAANHSIKGHTSSPTDTMLVLDVSGSMVDDTTSVGYVRWGNNNYQEARAIDMSLINAMVEATNATIKALMEQNTNNRVGVVLYSGNTSTYESADYNDATVVLPLGRYTGVNGSFLSVNAQTTTSELYTYNQSTRRWTSAGTSTPYVASGTAVSVTTASGLKTETGANVASATKRVTGGTYIQNGLYKAMEEFKKVTDTTVPEGKAQAGAERMPVIVLMSDGAPTIATTNYTDTKTQGTNTGDGSATNDRITFLTQLTAAYVRGEVAAKYQENSSDEKEILFLTLGLGTENSAQATNTLYPAGSDAPLTTYWANYLAASAGSNVNVGDNLTVARNASVGAMNYVDKYFYANNAQGLINSFKEILGEIELKAASYTTLVEGTNADLSGYVTFEDELGELMEVYNVSGILMGNTLYTGIELAKRMNAGELGPVGAPNEKGNELIATVKERITGTTTTQAQQLLANAYNDKQLYYADDNNWGNCISWYADADGKYVGFWDKDSGYANAPADAVYANKSYAYLGENQNSDMMHVVVMVRTDLKTLHQTVFFKIPAALLPTVQYRITLNENDPSKVDAFTREGAEPIRLVFEAGVRSDINAVNMEKKIAEHLAKGDTHIHRDPATGAVTFFTNQFSIGNDLNGNGIPDANEVDSAVVAESHFHPAMDNARFYYTEDTLVLDANGNVVTGSTRPTDLDGDGNFTTGYYYNRYVYTSAGRTTIKTPIAAATLDVEATYDSANNRWYIPQGTMYHNLGRFKVSKDPAVTETLHYSFFPAAFDGQGKQDVYAFLGNNGSVTAMPATGFVLNKQVQGVIPGVTQYTFRVTLHNTSATPVLTDANGDALAGATMSAVSGGQFTVTLPAGVDAYITGIPAGTNVTVEELINGDYKVVDLKIANVDHDETAPATFTIPAYSASGPAQIVPVTFTNAANSYGDLVIAKDVHHNLASDPDALATKEFTFRVTLTGSKLKANDTFATSDAATTVQVTTDGTVTFDVKLHNEESFSIYRLPEGTAYQVEEINIPEGFAANQSSFSGVIVADSAVTTGFVNVYPDEYHKVEIPLNITVNKTLNEITPYSGNKDFVFVVQQLLSDGTYPNMPDVNTVEYLTVNGTGSKSSQWALSFDTPGTYYFRVIELKPSQQTPAGTDVPGMTYSTTQALFAVIVTDNDMNGKLEVAIREEAHVTASGTYTDANNHETITQINAEASFTNTYEVHSTSISVPVHKDLVNHTGVDVPLTGFQFGLYAVDANNDATGAPISTVTASAVGDAFFNIPITADQDLTYIIKEIVPANSQPGMDYSPAEYLLNIDVEADPLGQLSATSILSLKGGTGTVSVAVFENTYTLAGTSVSIPISKDFTGRDLLSGETYQTLAERTDDTFKPYPDGNANKWSAYYTLPVNASFNSVQLNYTVAGTYHYRFTEVIPADATIDPVSGKPVKNGVAYDASEYHVTVTVFDNNNGTLKATTTIHKLGQATAVNGVNFANTYTVNGEGSVTFSGKKVLDGRALAAGEFQIGLYSDPACTDLIEVTANNADGSFSFSAIPYTAADLGANSTPKTYTYYVKELTGNKGGVTYDPNPYTVSATVSHENGVLVVTPSSNATSLQISNTYKASDATATINGSKVLSGDWTNVPNKSFTFNLYKADASFNIIDQNPVKTATVNGNGNFSISLTYSDGQEGLYYYVLEEVIPDPKAGGVGYDAGEYHITVNVSDPGNGELVALTTLYRPGTGNTDTAVFTNTYSVEPTSITLVGTKRYINGATGSNLPINPSDFRFLVLEDSHVVSSGSVRPDCTIGFYEINYTAPGVYNYTVVEEVGDIAGVIYDENAVFHVTVTVTDNGDGTLTATADYNGKPIEFVNKYQPESAKVELSGSKLFTGDWSKVTNKTFAFWLYKTDATFAIEGVTPVEQTNGADNTFSFGTLTFDQVGTYYYYLAEKDAGKSDKGITNSDTYYKITVEVNDVNGELVPTVTVDTNAAAPTVTANGTTASVTGLNFTNDYAAAPVTYTPKAEKEYKGDDMKVFDFVLSGGGFAEQTKQNGTDGKVTFDTLTFDRADTYELTIREKKNVLWGFIRWDVNVYKLTVKVVDDGAGQLHIESVTVTSTLGTDDLVFRNTHDDLITDKDVYLASAPTVSIDGKKVQIGDELVYTISYTNYTGKVVSKVTVTDTLPGSLTYVEGSADKGGSFANGAVVWQLTDVPAGETVTVSFRAKVANTESAVSNTATVVDDENTYTTNEVINPVTNDEMTKTVAKADAPTVSIDGKKVQVGDELIYTITYVNGDDQAAKVTITDTLSKYVVYVDGSADNGGVYANGTVAWTLELAAGESKTVSFKAIVKDAGATIVNQAQSYDGVNKLSSNTVTTYTPAPPATPQTGDEMHLVLWLSLLLISAAGMAALVVSRKRFLQ